MDDRALLVREMDTLWGDDLYGRPRREPPLVALALALGGRAVRFASGGHPDLERALLADLDSGLEPSEALGRLAALLGRTNARLEGGPTYAFSMETLSPSAPTGGKIVTSDRGTPDLADARPVSWNDPQEWGDLIAGRLGPWAIGLDRSRVVAVCHTPVASPLAAEAGVWTLPEARGRGWSPATARAWARACGDRFATLFYSTSFDNAASQAVARTLGLRPVGTIWQLR